MQGGRGGRDPFFGFGDPFGGFGDFGGFGGHRSLLSGFLGGRNPFDDPFFTRPFGGIFETQPFGGMLEPGLFGPNLSPFADMHPSARIEYQPQEPKRSRGPIIEELDSEDDKEEANVEQKENPRKHKRSTKEPYVEDPDDVAEGRGNKQLQYRNDRERFNNLVEPHSRGFTFHSSTVTYGGANGAYYTSSKMRRTGSDGVTLEESREADTTTRQATHKISRALHDKGHSVTRKLNSDGRVDTMQTLHNLNEGELTGFEESWKGKAKHHLPGWNRSFNGSRFIGDDQDGHVGRGGWALPSTERPQPLERMVPNNRVRGESSRPHQPGRSRGHTEQQDKGSRS